MTDSVGVAIGPVPAGRQARDRGYWAQAGHDLCRDWTAMIGLVIVLAIVAAAVFAPLLAPHDPNVQNRLGLSIDGSPLGPSSTYPAGTDAAGRDELSRLLFGARIS